MKTLFIALGTLLFTTTQFYSFGNCNVNTLTLVKSSTIAEPKTVKLMITGMTCAGCSNHVATTLKALEGVVEQIVEYPGNVATIKYNPAKTSVAAIIKAIEKIGYKAVAVSEKSSASHV